MLSNVTKLEVKIDERDYQFLCTPDSPLGHVKEAIFQFMKIVGQIEDRAIAQQQAQEVKVEENVS